MTIENAILLLSKKAEFAQQKANNSALQRKANDFVEITNTIIDFYNNVEKINAELHHTNEIIQILCEYIGIRQVDIDDLKNIPAGFIRTRLAYRIPEQEMPHWLFHRICVDYEMLKNLYKQKQFIEEVIMPILKSKLNNEVLLKEYETSYNDTLNMIQETLKPE